MKKIFFFLLLLPVFCLMAGAAMAGEIVLQGIEWKVERISSDIRSIFPSAVVRTVVVPEYGDASLQFRDDSGFTVAIEVVPADAFGRPGRILGTKALAMIQMAQSLTPAYEYRIGEATNEIPFPRWSDGIQVHRNAPFLKTQLEVVDKGEVMTLKYEVIGRDLGICYQKITVPKDQWPSHIHPGFCRRAWDGDGSAKPVSTIAVFAECNNS